MSELARLHHRLLVALCLTALMAFISGAGLEAPLVLVSAAVLLLTLIWQPQARLYARWEWLTRVLALALAVRAIHFALNVPGDVVLPMVDVLLVLMIAEALRPFDWTRASRLLPLSFALLIAAAAYRAGVIFGAAFVAYIGLGTLTLLSGHVLRDAHRFAARPPALPRPFLVRVVALSSIMLFMSGLLFVAFPRVTRTWVTRGNPVEGSVIGFSDRVSLAEHGGRIYANPEVVLRVEFPDGERPDPRALYWRGRSYDFFDGTGWWRSPRVRRASVPMRMYRERWLAPRLQQKIYAVPLDVPVLFALYPTLHVQPQSRMRWSSDGTGDLWYDGVGPPIYRASSIVRQPSDRVVREASGSAGRTDDAYLQLPKLTPATQALADSLVGSATSRIDQVRAVEAWLRTRFRYTLELPSTAREATLDHFLFRRRAGHCEYFSTAMVVLLRAAGVPARNVNGFMGGEWNEFGNYLSVTQNQAHSWVEAWFPEFGWLTFDPTPSATTDVAAAQQSWFQPFRYVLDGLEHRWNKWVLEYNVDLQMNLFRRAADAVAPARAPQPARAARPRTRFVPFLLTGILLLLMGRILVGSRHSVRNRNPVETRLYLRLRRIYRRLGIAADHDAPLAFLDKLKLAHAPGIDHAQRLVHLYLESRFGAVNIGAEGRAHMHSALALATRAVRRPNAA
ncbi:MAG: transglutaminaseTgpA domain-containing protein [Longimicrobiales bacterium]